MQMWICREALSREALPDPAFSVFINHLDMAPKIVATCVDDAVGKCAGI